MPGGSPPRPSGLPGRWLLASPIFGYGTGTAKLVAVGATSGLGVGIAQWPLLRDRVRASAAWIPAIAGLWALGWTVSTAIGVDLQRWAVFGASGAVTVAVLSGALLWALRQESPRRAGEGARITTEAWAAVLLIAAPLWFNATIAVLGKRFGYPDILRRPTEEILERFRAGGPVLIMLWWAFMLSGLLLIGVAVLLSQALGFGGLLPLAATHQACLRVWCKCWGFFGGSS